MRSSGTNASSDLATAHQLPARNRQRAQMRAKISWLLSATLLLGATAATAQSFSCASVAPEVRERVREAGACRDATSDNAAPNDLAPASSAVTVTLSDGTVVRVSPEIRANIRDGPKRAVTSKPEAPARASTQSEPADAGEPAASGEPPPAVQKPEVPDVSDGSLASAAGTTPITAPAPASTASSTPVPATDPTAPSAPAPVSASEPPVTPAPSARFPIAFFPNAVLILGTGVLLGLLFGALLARQWLLRRKLAADEEAAPPMPSERQQRIEPSAGSTSESGAVPEISFAARLDPGETTIEWGPLPDDDQVAIEHSSDHHA